MDLNLDGSADNVDYTEGGELWGEATRVHCSGCPGAHDTQFRWAMGLAWSPREFASAARLLGTMDGGKSAYITVDDQEARQCMQLVRPVKEHTGPFGLRMCDPKREPYSWSGFPAGHFGYYGDFNGDGYVDFALVTFTPAQGAPHGRTWLTLGKSAGTHPAQPWFSFKRRVQHHMLEWAPEHRRNLLLTEVMDVYGDATVYMICPAGGRAHVAARLQRLGARLHCAPLETDKLHHQRV